MRTSFEGISASSFTVSTLTYAPSRNPARISKLSSLSAYCFRIFAAAMGSFADVAIAFIPSRCSFISERPFISQARPIRVFLITIYSTPALRSSARSFVSSSTVIP